MYIASPSTGLTSNEASALLSRYGPNELISYRRRSQFFQFLPLFINPLAIILLIASAISAAVGEVLNAAIIAAVVVMSAGLNFFQTYRSQRAVDRVRKEVAPTATALRDVPTQILLNNFLYDLAQVTITDKVDQTFIHKPQRWNVKLIRDFMVYIGPLSSSYDFLTFFALLKIFHASEQFFHTGWFVESLATQTLVIFVIRTAGNPLQSKPSLALIITTGFVIIFAAVLPFTSLGALLGFAPIPFGFLLFVFIATGTYLILVEVVKRRLIRRQGFAGIT